MLCKQGLIRGLAATEGEEADTFVCKVDLGTNEAMRPVRTDMKSMTEK